MEKSIKGPVIQSIDSLFRELIERYKYDFTFDLSYQIKKPPMYNIWLICNKNAQQSEIDIISSRLLSKNFIKNNELESVKNELTKKHKTRLAIIPKSAIYPFINDIKTAINLISIELIINEFLE